MLASPFYSSHSLGLVDGWPGYSQPWLLCHHGCLSRRLVLAEVLIWARFQSSERPGSALLMVGVLSLNLPDGLSLCWSLVGGWGLFLSLPECWILWFGGFVADFIGEGVLGVVFSEWYLTFRVWLGMLASSYQWCPFLGWSRCFQPCLFSHLHVSWSHFASCHGRSLHWAWSSGSSLAKLGIWLWVCLGIMASSSH